jgi:hypothetical protein
MSAYITLATPMIDQECLLAALADMGFKPEQVRTHNIPVPLEGYEGSQRTQRAEIIIPRQYVGEDSNDIGFRLTPTGYAAIISAYDSEEFDHTWLKKLSDSYKHHEKQKFVRLEKARQAAEEEARLKAEQERRRLEEERRRLVDAQRQMIHEKARKLGYQVQEARQGDQVRLVLVKRVY